MGQTERELDVGTTAGQPLVAPVPIDVENTFEALNLGREVRHRASVGIDVSDRGRGRTAPRAIINGMAPELTAFGAPASRIEDRHRGLVGEHAGPGEDDRQLAVIERLQPPRSPLHPQRQGRAVEAHALTGKDLSLPIQRDVPGELGDRDMGDQRGCGHAALDRRGGLLAWTIAPSQVRQAYFGKIVRFTRTKAGTTSRASRVSSPIRWSAPAQQGQAVVSGSITSSHRGRCLGSAPMLRTAGRRGRSTLRSVPPSSLAGGGGGVGPTARSSRSSGSWATSITAARSERAPKRRSFKVRTIARKRSFSVSSASTIATRRAGSEGTSSGRSGMLQIT